MPYQAKAEKVLIPNKIMVFSTGTWTHLTNTGIPYASKAAAAGTSKILIPISLPSKDGQYGIKLTAIKVPIRVATAALVSTPTAELYKREMLAVAGASADIVASTITITSTGLTLTADAQDRLTTHTISSTEWDYSSSYDIDYNLILTMNAATTSAIRIYDAIAYYEVLV